jgi:hypothetical protein
MTQQMQIERHDGPPIHVLDDVRREHNVVGAFVDAESARGAILALEQAGVDPNAIALLGAWPDEDRQRSPVTRYRRMTYMALVGATLVGAGGFLSFGRSWAWAVTGAILGGAVGVTVGWALAMGLSQAWEETFMVDDNGTFAVGVHSGDPEEILRARPVLTRHGALAVNTFGRKTRRRVR